MNAFLTIASLHLLAVISPGPDFAVVVKNALGFSRKQGIYTALGIAFGLLVHLFYCVMGLALVISQSKVAFNLIKFLGGGYLIYLGVMSLMARESKIVSEPNPNDSQGYSNFKAFREGFLTNVLNPKATIFFLSVFALVIDSTTPIFIQSLYGLEMFVVTFLWFSFLSFLVTSSQIQPKLNKMGHWVNRVIGTLLIAFGLKVLF